MPLVLAVVAAPTVAVQGGPVYVVDGSYTAPCSLSEAWAVLTDFAGYPRFVSTVQRSDVRVRDGRRVVVSQQGVERLFGFPHEFHLVLELRLDPQRRIAFRDVDRRDFTVYEGAWTARAIPGGVEVRYHVRVRPRGDPPAIFAKAGLRSGVTHVLTQVRAEMLRRRGGTQPAIGGGSSRPLRLAAWDC